MKNYLLITAIIPLFWGNHALSGEPPTPQQIIDREVNLHNERDRQRLQQYQETQPIVRVYIEEDQS